MSRLKITLTGVALFSMVVLAFIGFTGGRTHKLTDHDIARNRVRAEVFELCNIARQEENGKSEEMCGKIQDTTNTEYVCEKRNKSPVNHCWVEDK